MLILLGVLADARKDRLTDICQGSKKLISWAANRFNQSKNRINCCTAYWCAAARFMRPLTNVGFWSVRAVRDLSGVYAARRPPTAWRKIRPPTAAVSLAQDPCHAASQQALCKKRAKACSVLRRGFEGRGRGALRRDAGRVSGWPQCELSATRLHKQDFTVHKQSHLHKL